MDSPSAAETEPTVEFRWEGFEPGDPDADEALYRLKREGADAAIPTEGRRGIAVIPIILGAIAVIGLAKAIKSFIDDMKVGMVIDARGEKVTVTKDNSLGRGTVLLINKDGSLRLENPDSEKLSDLIKGAVGGLK
jgi:hypothetical protein